MKEKMDGGFIVCSDTRLEPTGAFRNCFKPEDAGTHIAVKLVKRMGPLGYWEEVASGYWAEIVITPPIADYRGPPTPCRLPDQFKRFERKKEATKGS